MFIELLDTLRCVADHPQIPLVTAITGREDRYVMEAVMGCPTCRREYPIKKGVAWFGARRGVARQPSANSPREEEGAMRIGALLAAADGTTVALVGNSAPYAFELAEMIDLRVFAVNPRVEIGESERVGIVYSDNRLPFSEAALRGVAIGEPGWSDRDMKVATRVLAAGGRMVAPASTSVPHEIEEIARDDSVWVGEKRGPLVALHRR